MIVKICLQFRELEGKFFLEKIWQRVWKTCTMQCQSKNRYSSNLNQWQLTQYSAQFLIYESWCLLRLLRCHKKLFVFVPQWLLISKHVSYMWGLFECDFVLPLVRSNLLQCLICFAIHWGARFCGNANDIVL